MIKVRAIRAGFYGQFRDEGHEFEISHEKHFSKSWMQKVGEAAPEEAAPESDQSPKSGKKDKKKKGFFGGKEQDGETSQDPDGSSSSSGDTDVL